MKVAAVFLGMPVGGAEDLAIGLARSLKPKGILTHFVCLRSLDALGEELAAAGESISLIPAAPHKRYSRSGTRLLAAWLRENQIRLVHSHTYHAHVYAAAAAKQAKIPHVVHHHKTLEKMKWHRWWTMLLLLRRASHVLALSEKTADDLATTFRLPKVKVTALPNAVDEAIFYPANCAEKKLLRVTLGLDEEAFVFLTAASLHPVKNHALLLASVRQIVRQGLPTSVKKCIFVIAGTGPLQNSLAREAADLCGDVEVRLVGAQRPVAPWFRSADAFVFPSLWEGQSMALLQAIRCELPVLASRIEGNTAILSEAHPGLFPSGSAENLSQLMLRILREPQFLHDLRSFQNKLPLPRWEPLVTQLASIYTNLHRKPHAAVSS